MIRKVLGDREEGTGDLEYLRRLMITLCPINLPEYQKKRLTKKALCKSLILKSIFSVVREEQE
jgi:hypothetical protein